MRLLQVNTEKTWRGGERQTLFTIKGLMDKGVSVDVLCLKNYPLSSKTELLGLNTISAPSQCDAARYLKKEGRNYDIIHAQSAKAQTLSVLTKPYHKRPVLYTRRVDFVPKGFLTKLKYKNTDRIVAVSNSIKHIMENMGLENIEVIIDAIEERKPDNERANSLLNGLGIAGKKIIATTSALAPHKDPFTMIKAVKKLSAMRDDFVFLHFGSGELIKRAGETVKKEGLEGIYFLMGHHDDVEELFGIFDVFVMTSNKEGYGSSVLDAFVSGVPVVSTDAGGLRECVGDRGVLCGIGDYNCIAKAVDRVMEDGHLRESLKEKALKYVRENNTLDVMIDKYTDIYRDMLVEG